MISLMSTFVAVVDAGGFSQAARRLGHPKSALSRRLDQLEDQLGVRLLQRSTRFVKPTEAGQEYYRRCVHILAEIDEAERVVRQDQLTPSGRLRVQLPVELGMHLFGKLLAEFAREHPGVSLDLELSNSHADMIESEFDLAIRIGAMPDSSLIARKMFSIPYGFFASPSYLQRAGEPASVNDLPAHSCLRFETDYISGDWVMHTGTERKTFHPTGVVTVNSLSVLRDSAICGLGIAMLPALLCQEAVQAGSLRQILRDVKPEEAEVFVLYPSREHLAVKVKAFLGFLDQRAKQISDWINTPFESLGAPVAQAREDRPAGAVGQQA